MCPAPSLSEFRDDVVRVAGDRKSDVTIEQIAMDFGGHQVTPRKWMRRTALEEATKRIQLLEQEVEVLRPRRPLHEAGTAARRAGIEAEDSTRVPPYENYTSLQSASSRTGWFSARVLPPAKAITNADGFIAKAEARYGAPLPTPVTCSDR